MVFFAAKTKKTLAILAVCLLLCGGCCFVPSGLYIYRQCENEPQHVRQTNPLPVGNIVYLNTKMIEVACNEEDYVLPTWLDRTLNIFCIIQGYPVSLVFDILLWPYQLWRYHHLPPEEPPQPAKPEDKPVEVLAFPSGWL